MFLSLQIWKKQEKGGKRKVSSKANESLSQTQNQLVQLKHKH